MQKTFSVTEIADAKKEGWTIVKETILAGKVRSALMTKEGVNPFEWFDGINKEKEATYNAMNKTQKRLHREFVKRYSRGLE